jgi:hypothetical protein
MPVECDVNMVINNTVYESVPVFYTVASYNDFASYRFIMGVFVFHDRPFEEWCVADSVIIDVKDRVGTVCCAHCTVFGLWLRKSFNAIHPRKSFLVPYPFKSITGLTVTQSFSS